MRQPPLQRPGTVPVPAMTGHLSGKSQICRLHQEMLTPRYAYF